ncbi:hypothetical protein Bca4012_010886 [Brassica carinata]
MADFQNDDRMGFRKHYTVFSDDIKLTLGSTVVVREEAVFTEVVSEKENKFEQRIKIRSFCGDFEEKTKGLVQLIYSRPYWWRKSLLCSAEGKEPVYNVDAMGGIPGLACAAKLVRAAQLVPAAKLTRVAKLACANA